ncbi:small basic family protein [Candidatus Microgenomates bacterium]|nr:small basic family protein [Candidatus Microgenomates bacterium]
MFYTIFGIILGIVFGALVPINIPVEYSRYTAVAILVILDILIAAVRDRAEKQFSTANTVTSLIFYVVLTSFFVYLGDKLNIDLYLGVTVVFMFRIIQNISILKDIYFGRFWDGK